MKNKNTKTIFSPVGLSLTREIGNIRSSILTDRILRSKLATAKNLYRREFKACGGDDRRIMLWNVEKALNDIGSPTSMKGEHNSNVFCLAFDHENRKIFSGGNDGQVLVHDIASKTTLDVFSHEDAVYGVTSDPINPNVFASACDDGRILVFDIREPASTDPFCLANYTSSMHAVSYNPVEPRLLATANAREGIGLWDIRKPRSCLLRYGGGLTQQSSMSVCINKMGTRLLALRRRLPPVLYDIKSPQPLCDFDHVGYYNSCTMKSCSFAGDKDQYVLSGSDDCNLYMWRIPDDLSERQFVSDAHMVLHGSRSIVNQVRFNSSNHLVVSSGVEKSIKVWSPFPIPNSEGGTEISSIQKSNSRPAYSHEDYISLVLQSGTMMSHDYSSQSMEEDPRMLAFFDSLVQRELAGISSSDEFNTSEEELFERIQNLTGSDLSDTESNHSNREENDADNHENPFTVAFASAESRSLEGNRNPVSSASGGHYSDISDTSDSDSSTETENANNTHANRKTIDQLIREKREQLKHKGMKKRKRRLLTHSSSSSDSSSEGNESSDNSEANNERIRKTNSILSACRQKNKNNPKLKRLKLLRENLLKSDSDVEDGMNLTECETKDNEVCAENPKNHKSKTCTNGNMEGEVGPFLHEALENQPSCSKSLALTSHTLNHGECSQRTENQPSCSKLLPHTSNVLNHGECAKTTVASGCLNNGEASDSENSKDKDTDGQSKQTWTEFKRFKNKGKNRKYRSHSQNDEN